MTPILPRRGVLLALPAAAALASSPLAAWAAAEPLRVVATTGMIADIVRQVAGDRAEVVALMGEGVDPHLYRATRSDVARMLEADVVFYNGLLLEGKMTDALVRVARSGKPVFAVTELIDESYLLAPPGFEGSFDPHVWMDPRAWEKAVEVVQRSLAEVDPEGAEGYHARSATYLERLRGLDGYAERVLATVPPERRVLVTAHDAFNYFGRRYGFEVMGIQGLSTESEAGLKRIEELVSTLVERGIPAVFVETTIPEQSVRALIAGAEARGHEVVVGGSLFSDAMGRPGTYEGTYVGMIDHNVTAIARALGGETPPRGLNGQLAQAR
jgi:manganese/zinc/iron transport system substrate-binding protein